MAGSTTSSTPRVQVVDPSMVEASHASRTCQPSTAQMARFKLTNRIARGSC